MTQIPNHLPGRKCSWCGKHGGAGFTRLVANLQAVGVVFKFLNGSGMEYLHPGCARKAQEAAQAGRAAVVGQPSTQAGSPAPREGSL